MNLAELIELPTWMERGACHAIVETSGAKVRNDLFFPERGQSTKPAKAICQRCPVREQCLEYALVNGERFGIWGGLSERERRRIRKQRREAGEDVDLPKPIDHGSRVGYQRCRRRPEGACRLCLEANARYQQPEGGKRSGEYYTERIGSRS